MFFFFFFPLSLQIDKANPTGSCICLIYEDNRCCFANIGAALNFHYDILAEPMHRKPLEPIGHQQIFYIEGFFVTSKLAVCKYIFEQFCYEKSEKIFAANLSAEYMIDENPVEMNYLADNSEMLFGNRSEFKTLAKVRGAATLDELIEMLNGKMMGKRKIIVVTNGDKFVDVYDKSALDVCEYNRYDVIVVPKKDIVDTTGAGDSFVAGFFYAYLRNEPLADCVRFGIETAAKKIRVIGAKLSDDCH